MRKSEPPDITESVDAYGRPLDYDHALRPFIGCIVRYVNEIEKEGKNLDLEFYGRLSCGLDGNPENAIGRKRRYNVIASPNCAILIPGGRWKIYIGVDGYFLSDLKRTDSEEESEEPEYVQEK